jgi:hypothetical protein
MIGLLAAAPVAAFAQEPTTPAPAAQPQAAKADGRTYTGGRHHPDAATTAALAVAPPAGPGRSISEKGVKKTEAPPAAALTVAPPTGAGKGHNEKGVK